MQNKRAFCLIFLLNLCLFILLCLKSTNFLASSLSASRFHLPTISYFYLMLCGVSQIILIGLLSLLLTLATIPYKAHFKLNKQNHLCLIIAFCFLSTLGLFLANQLLYPLSIYSKLMNQIIPSLRLSQLIAVSIFIFFLTSLSWYLLDTFRTKCVFLLAIPILLFLSDLGTTPLSAPPPKKPNIVLLGIDSLRLSEIKNMPFLKSRLKKFAYFKHSLTPLSRTHPSWLSILTGQYPLHHGARTNVINPINVKQKHTLAWRLKKAGYQTFFATDDRRFSQIGKTLGFDISIGPPSGVNDFIQSSINDFPLSNLIINTRLGKLLFPYNYNNRESDIHYDPRTFVKEVSRSLKQMDRQSPFLIAIHLTLPHYPYTWRQSSIEDQRKVDDKFQMKTLYPKVIARTDKQLKNIFIHLQRQRLLDNTIIVLLSDHSETLYEPGGRITDERHYVGAHKNYLIDYLKLRHAKQNYPRPFRMDISAHHGNDALSFKQNQTLLAFSFPPPFKPKTMPSTYVNLMDIYPTLVDYLKLAPMHAVDGQSLLPMIFKHQIIRPRYHFIETGFSPETIDLSGSKKISTSIAIGKRFFTIDVNTDKLYIRQDKLPFIKSRKELAVFYKHYLLALYPSKHMYFPICVDTMTKKWSDDLNSALCASPPLKVMLKKLTAFYQLSPARIIG